MNKFSRVTATIALAAASTSLAACGSAHTAHKAPAPPTASNGVVGKNTPTPSESSNTNSVKPTPTPSLSTIDKAAADAVAKQSLEAHNDAVAKAKAKAAAPSQTPASGTDSNGDYSSGIGQKSNAANSYGGYSNVPSNANIGANPVKDSSGGGGSNSSNGTSSHTYSAAQGSTIGYPVSLSIPSIGLNQYLSTVTAYRGVVAPLPGRVSWYRGPGGVAPGNNGIAKILGHVTYNGPDVFYNLRWVPVGAKITIRYSSGATKTFTVYQKASVNKTQLTRDQRIWGGASTPIIALLSCDGLSRWVGLHHVNNYVVWAK